MKQRLKRAIKAFVKELFFPEMTTGTSNAVQDKEREGISEAEFLDHLERIISGMQGYYEKSKDLADKQINIHSALLTAIQLYRKQKVFVPLSKDTSTGD